MVEEYACTEWCHRAHYVGPRGRGYHPAQFLSFRCLYSSPRIVWLIGISKPVDYHFSHLCTQWIHANGGFCPNIIFEKVFHKENKHRKGRSRERKFSRVWKYFHCQFVLNRPPICSLWSFSRLFRNHPRVCKGAGRDEHNWYCGSHTLCRLKFHNR